MLPATKNQALKCETLGVVVAKTKILEGVHSKVSKGHKATMFQTIVTHYRAMGAVVGSGRHR